MRWLCYHGSGYHAWLGWRREPKLMQLSPRVSEQSMLGITLHGIQYWRWHFSVIWWYKKSPRQFIGATTAHRGRSRRTALCKPNAGGMWFSMLQFHQGPCCRCTSGTARSMATARRLRGQQHSSGAGRCADKPDSWNDRDRFHQQKGPNVGMRQKLQSKMHITGVQNTLRNARRPVFPCHIN